MYRTVYEELLRVARDRNVGVTTYGELARLVHINLNNMADRYRLRDVLDQINRDEHGQEHPMLSSVVIYIDKNRPGDGFFTLAREFGLYSGGSNEEDKLAFWTAELKRVHDFWQR